MRPLELSLRNFRSYFGDGATFDLRGRSLVGVVGPIGSGKSSLLDAVAFALYGRTPAGGTATKRLIHQRADTGGVKLRFEVEGEIWEAVRSLRRKGQSQHALYRYDGDGDGDPVEKVTTETDVNRRIEELLGLDFDAFAKSVLLAQGRFAEFLTAGATARDTVLKGVFGHDRIDAMREVARLRSADAAAELGKIAIRIDQLERVAARLADAAGRLAALDERVEKLRKAEPRLTDLDARLDAARSERDAAESRLEALARHAGGLPERTATADLLGEAGKVEERRQRLALEAEVAHEARKDAEARLADLDRAGETAVLEEAARLLAENGPRQQALADAERRRGSLADRIAERQSGEAGLLADLEAAAVGVAAAEAALAAVDEALTTARADLHDARHDDMAATLRSDLAPGAPCPVCLRAVEDVPEGVPPVAVDVAVAAVADAEAQRAQAEKGRTAAAVRLAEAEAAVAAAAETSRRLADELGDVAHTIEPLERDTVAAETRLADLLGEGDPAELVAERRRLHTDLVEAAAEARRVVDQLRPRHDEAIRDQQVVERRVQTLQRELVALASRLDVVIELGEEGDHAAVADAVDRLRRVWGEHTADAREALARSDTVTGTVADERRLLLDSLGVVDGFAETLAGDQARAEQLAEQVAGDRAEIDASAEVLAERDRLTSVKARHDRIAFDLTDSRFVRFLLDEERARLAELGSEHFMQLSSGRYRFTEDGAFDIVDLTAADAVRKAASLSGGETFLASLALALALAEMVARTGGRLDAFFLDEGFGSLDPEHLDLAMEGIEALVAGDSNRLVVVVSHVPELRHRIEDLIHLDRDPLTGDTRIVRA